MKKKYTHRIIVTIITILMLASTSPALASGGQVRGEKAQGAAHQVQVQNPPPFQP